MKRFFKQVAVVEREAGFQVTLDGKPVRTPAKAAMVLPTRALAEAVAAEWRAQGAEIKPDTMPLTRLAGLAIDQVALRREAVVDEVAAYAGADLVCYRAERPPRLRVRQDACWQPLVDWAAARYDARLKVGSGIVPLAQPAEVIESYRRVVAAFDDMMLAALRAAAAACGSLVIALALREGRLDAVEAFEASQLDEAFQIEQWGEDPLAARRRAGVKADIADAAAFMALCRG